MPYKLQVLTLHLSLVGVIFLHFLDNNMFRTSSSPSHRAYILLNCSGTDEVNFNQFVQVLSVFRSVYDVEAFVGGDEAETENQIEKLRTEKMRCELSIWV